LMIPAYPQSLNNPAVAPPVLWWLRLEGLALAVLAAIVYSRIGFSWWLFAGLWLLPDLSFIGYLTGPRWGALAYNVAHTEVFPATLVAYSVLLHQPSLLPFACIWFNHIGVDRLLGYGLKYPAGFGFTHLNRAKQLRPPNAIVPHP